MKNKRASKKIRCAAREKKWFFWAVLLRGKRSKKGPKNGENNKNPPKHLARFC